MSPLLRVAMLATLAARDAPANKSGVALFRDLPAGYSSDVWAFVDTQTLAYIPGTFNRSVWSAVWDGTASDPAINAAYDKLKTTKFVAYHQRFLDIAGPDATIRKIADLPQVIHEAPSWIPETNQLLFTEWGNINDTSFAQHPWQWLIDLDEGKNFTKHNVTFDPPVQNLHGSMYFDGKIYGCTDGGNGTYASIVEIDVNNNFSVKYLLNNWFGHPFAGFNDLFVDKNSNIWVSDSPTAYSRGITPFTPSNPSGTFFINTTSLVVTPVGDTEQKGNGLTTSPDGKYFYAVDTGASTATGKDPLGVRTIKKYNIVDGNSLTQPRVLASPLSYIWDGIRASRNGWIVAAASEGVDIVDPTSGLTLGTFHVGQNVTAVNIAFRPGGYIYLVGKGGAWEIKAKEEFAWDDARYTGQR